MAGGGEVRSQQGDKLFYLGILRSWLWLGSGHTGSPIRRRFIFLASLAIICVLIHWVIDSFIHASEFFPTQIAHQLGSKHPCVSCVGYSHSNYHRHKVVFLYLLFAECPLSPWDSAVASELKTCSWSGGRMNTPLREEDPEPFLRPDDLGPFPRLDQGLSAIHSFPLAFARVNRQWKWGPHILLGKTDLILVLNLSQEWKQWAVELNGAF